MAPSFDPLASNRSLNSVSSGGSSSISSRSKSKGKARDLGEVFLPPLPAQKQTFMPRSPSNNWSVEQQFDPSSRRRRRTGAGSRLGHDSEGLGLSEDEEDDVLSETRSFGSASLRHQSRPASPASSSSIPIITTNTADTQRPKTAPLLPRPRLEARIDRVMRPRNNTPSTPEVDSDEELMNVDRRPSRQMLSLAAALKESKVDDASKTPATPLRTSSSHAHSKSLTSKQFRRRSATATASSSPTTPVMDSPRKQKEEGWHVDIMVYARLPTSSMSMSASTSSFALDQLGGMINKPVFIKNVPADRKRSNTRRESAQVTLSPASPSSSDSRPRAGSSLNNSFTYGPCGPQSGAWGWRRAEAIVKDSGLLTIETLDDQIPIHSIPVSLLTRTDIALVHPTLLGKRDCLSIHISTTKPSMPTYNNPLPDAPRSADPRTKSTHSFLPFNLSRSSSDHNTPTLSSLTKSIETEEQVYLSFSTKASLQAFYTLVKTFANIEIVRPLKLRESLDSLDQERTPSGSRKKRRSTETPSIRFWRSIELVIIEGRNLGEQQLRSSTDQKVPAHASKASTSVDNLGAYSLPQKKSSTASYDKREETASPSTSSSSSSAFCEIVLNEVVIAKTTLKKGLHAPFWRQAFTFEDLPPFTDPLQIRLYQAQTKKGLTNVALLGVAEVPLATFRRGEQLEQWFPLLVPNSSVAGCELLAGEVSMRIKVEELAILPSEEYAPLNDLLADESDRMLFYDLAAGSLSSDLETTAELFLRIFLAQGSIVNRIKQMVEIEIDGDESSASILFRGNSVLTKLFELYIRYLCTNPLIAFLADPVTRLCEQQVEIEIDPARLPSSSKLSSNIEQLKIWTTRIWDLIYSGRQVCPNEMSLIFQHIANTIASRYPQAPSSMKTTSISAFLFLRFFVPALLNPHFFGLTQTLPEPKSQRTLTLIAKTLQGMANMSKFGTKEAYMAAMNPFIEDNVSTFVDLIHLSSTPKELYTPTWQNKDYSLYSHPLKKRAALTNRLARDGVPSLPNALDTSKDLALCAALVARARALNPVGESRTVKGSTDSKAPVNPNVTAIERLCIRLHEKAQAHAVDFESVSGEQTVLNMTRKQPIDEALDRSAYFTSGSSPIDSSFARSASESTSRRNRAQTVSATPTRLVPGVYTEGQTPLLRNLRSQSPVFSTKMSSEMNRSFSSSSSSVTSTQEGDDESTGSLNRFKLFRRK